ncbi:hypothetical protein GGP41_004102 [Bipolaris sorokiniana]|uniref:Uncharacterized protein n=1 Tax=Cochliobolus sativus TaxID=45130 RepID=A0A8H5ZP85_COCSA|nr:hypothetical protein GGP41_004102 [Bipolaris sorokiniana]
MVRVHFHIINPLFVFHPSSKVIRTCQAVRGSIYGYFQSYILAVLICRTSIYRSTGHNDKLFGMGECSLHLLRIYTTTFHPVTSLSTEQIALNFVKMYAVICVKAERLGLTLEYEEESSLHSVTSLREHRRFTKYLADAFMSVSD